MLLDNSIINSKCFAFLSRYAYCYYWWQSWETIKLGIDDSICLSIQLHKTI